MKAEDLLAAVIDFRNKFEEHYKLWGESLDNSIPNWPIRNNDILRDQSKQLNRMLGSLRPYLLHYRRSWSMSDGRGRSFDAFDIGLDLSVIAIIKGDVMRFIINALDQIIGRLEGITKDEEILGGFEKENKNKESIEKATSQYLIYLHNHISESCSMLFNNGHYIQAVEESAKAVFSYLRSKTDLQIDGVNLVERAFSLKNPILRFSNLSNQTQRNEQLGFMEILKGYAKGVRNPLTHTQGEQEDMHIAFEYLVVASLFCRRIDDAYSFTFKSNDSAK